MPPSHHSRITHTTAYFPSCCQVNTRSLDSFLFTPSDYEVVVLVLKFINNSEGWERNATYKNEYNFLKSEKEIDKGIDIYTCTSNHRKNNI